MLHLLHSAFTFLIFILGLTQRLTIEKNGLKWVRMNFIVTHVAAMQNSWGGEVTEAAGQTEKGPYGLWVSCHGHRPAHFSNPAPLHVGWYPHFGAVKPPHIFLGHTALPWQCVMADSNVGISYLRDNGKTQLCDKWTCEPLCEWHVWLCIMAHCP